MKITFFIGNGFDLNQNLKTSYPQFLDEYFYNTQKESKIIKEFKRHLLDCDCWSDLELALGSMLAKYNRNTVDDFISGLEDLKEKLSLYLKKQEECFKYKIRKIKKELKRTIMIYNTKNGYSYPFYDLYADESDENEISFVSFNYTRIINNMCNKIRRKRLSLDWKNTKNNIRTVLSVHGDTKTGFILGLNDSTQIHNDDLRDHPKLLKHLIKKEQIKVMNRGNVSTNLENIIYNSDVIYVYGLSIGETDNMYWDSICEWLNTTDKHILIVNKFNPNFSAINMGDIAVQEEKILNFLAKHGASPKALKNQIHNITNSTIFTFIKKSKCSFKH